MAHAHTVMSNVHNKMKLIYRSIEIGIGDPFGWVDFNKANKRNYRVWVFVFFSLCSFLSFFVSQKKVDSVIIQNRAIEIRFK